MKLLNKMRNTGLALLGGVALLTLTAGVTGCSNNEADGLYAADGSNIGISIEALGFHNGLLDIGSAQSETVFTVTSTTRWTVEVTDCDGSWCQISYGEGNSDTAGHIGDGSFTVDAAPNRSGDPRECNVTVYAIESDGTHIPGKSVEVHVVQDRQSIQVDHSFNEITYQGTGNSNLPVITVKANQAWEVSTSHTWVKIVPSAAMDGNMYTPPTDSGEERTVSFEIRVDANPGTSVRYAEVTVSSPTQAFTPIRVNVTQSASTETFFVTPTEAQVSWEGEVVELSIYSPRESWTVQAISAGDWVTLDRTSGDASNDPVSIKATVRKNDTAVPRQASVVFTRANNMGTTVVTINPFASAEAPSPDSQPKISDPWLLSGWTANFAEVCAYFNSPVIPIIGAGVYYRSVSDPENDHGTVEGTINDNNRITAELTGLKPETRYEVWAFVRYHRGDETMVSTGGAIYFTTPGLNGDPGSGLPGQDDNTPPSPN